MNDLVINERWEVVADVAGCCSHIYLISKETLNLDRIEDLMISRNIELSVVVVRYFWRIYLTSNESSRL